MNYELVNKEIKQNYGEELLKERGIEDVKLFLNPTRKCVQNWEDLDNIFTGAHLIQDTIFSEKPYGLVVDADVDGFTSSSILYQYIKLINPDKQIDYFLHNGKQHGLEDCWKRFLEKDYDVIIVPDAASNDSQYASNLKYPVLVLDHHILEDEYLSENLVLINNQTSNKYRNKNLSGAGVVWQFCRALDYLFNVNYTDDFIDLAALGIN